MGQHQQDYFIYKLGCCVLWAYSTDTFLSFLMSILNCNFQLDVRNQLLSRGPQTVIDAPPNSSATCQSYSRAGTAEVDLINFTFIQTANYTQTHNHSLRSTIKSRWRGRKAKPRGVRARQEDCNKNKEIEGDEDGEGQRNTVQEEQESVEGWLLLSLGQVFYLSVSRFPSRI